MYSWSSQWANQSMTLLWNCSWLLAHYEIHQQSESLLLFLTMGTHEHLEKDKRDDFLSQSKISLTFWSKWELIKSLWLTPKALTLEGSLETELHVTTLISVLLELSICLIVCQTRTMIIASLCLQTLMELKEQNPSKLNSWEEDSTQLDLQLLWNKSHLNQESSTWIW